MSRLIMPLTSRSIVLLGILFLAAPSLFADTATTVHPLDPLTREEIQTAVQVLKSAGKTSETTHFATIFLHEPPKKEVWGLKPGQSLPRQAFVVVYDQAPHATYEAVVDLGEKRVVTWKRIPGVQPWFMDHELALVDQIVKADLGWQKAMRARGITDLQNVQVDPWSGGNFGFPQEEGTRMARAVCLYRKGAKNGYARPIEGLVAHVDLRSRKVLRLVDTGIVPISRALAELDEKSVGKLREAPKPLQTVQPEGASFQVRGQEVRWQSWRFRFALHPREGLVLYTVGYEDGGKTRPILYRASLSEMVVPYGDPGPAWFFRNAFDMGEFGLGLPANALEGPADYPANARLFDTVLANSAGEVLEFPRTVALYERDGGLLWKHTDYTVGHREARRARQLVLTYVATAGNYEYAFDWVFHQDGTLEVVVLMTGIMATKGVKAGMGMAHATPGHGHLVAPQIEAVHHQHFFNFRLDFDVDGVENSVVETNTESAPPGPNNPFKNAFLMKETVFRTEQQAQRQLNLATGRRWKVINPNVKNALDQPVGYLLAPGENAVPFAAEDSSFRRRAGFVSSHLWVTAYEPTEMNAAGPYVYQSKAGEGLPKWTAANRSIENRDVVLWYTLGVTHIPRPEEWPVMPAHRSGFRLIPSGFFARNPALDVPNR
jgi:primary-amine oxidase